MKSGFREVVAWLLLPLALVLAAPLWLSRSRAGEPEVPPAMNPGTTGGQTKPDGIVRFPSLRVDVKRGFLEADGQVCLQRGLIEVFACTKFGKVHEALLVLDCWPEHLHAGLLLLGMRATRGQVAALGDGGALEGERAIVTVRFHEGEQEVEKPAEELLLDAYEGRTMERCGFVFTGSRFVKVDGREVFAANASGQMITTFHDPDAILDNPLATGGDDTVYYANSKVLPPPGTPVIVRMRPAGKTPTDSTQACSPTRTANPGH